MMKRLSAYKAIIIDMDGTLYYQRPVRMAMLMEMLLHFWKLPDFLIIRRYRKLYEQGYHETDRLEMLPKRTGTVIREWMIDRPLKYVGKHRDKELIEVLRVTGITCIVYSDYPVKEKLQAIDYQPDYSYDASQLGCMKPEASGILKILDRLGVLPSDCLVIGDRPEKDGKLSENMGSEVLILPKNKKDRLAIYYGMEQRNEG